MKRDVESAGLFRLNHYVFGSRFLETCGFHGDGVTAGGQFIDAVEALVICYRVVADLGCLIRDAYLGRGHRVALSVHNRALDTGLELSVSGNATETQQGHQQEFEAHVSSPRGRSRKTKFSKSIYP